MKLLMVVLKVCDNSPVSRCKNVCSLDIVHCLEQICIHCFRGWLCLNLLVKNRKGEEIPTNFGLLTFIGLHSHMVF